MQNKPVVIAGGGLAGLSCANHLQKHDIPYLLIEASSKLGGRVQSLKKDGFILDVGFQVLLNSYPELPHSLDLQKLNLKKFNSGALICKTESNQAKNYLLANPVQHPSQIFSGLFSNLISVSDKSLVLKLIAKAHTHKKSASNQQSTEEFLIAFGFSPEFIEIFWRPFLSGVFLDPRLQVDSDFFLFLMKCFSTGAVTLPEKGMGEIPLQLCQNLDPEKIRTNLSLRSYETGQVTLSNSEKISCSQIVCAFSASEDGPKSNFKPSQIEEKTEHHSVSTYYFSTKADLEWEKWLVLIPPTEGIVINHCAVVSAVSPSYSEDGSCLISASVVGNRRPDPEQVKANLQALTSKNIDYKFIHSFHIPKALPKFNHKAPGVLEKDGILFCGDHLSSPSINGALRSGRMAAEAVIKKLS